MLEQLNRQTRRIDFLVVVDNASDTAVREMALTANATYIDSESNLGPAGGLAVGIEHVLGLAKSNDWIMLFDDDDPPDSEVAIEHLWTFAHECSARISRMGAVGLAGARYIPNRGVVQRVQDAELEGLVEVDHIGGGKLPLYSVKALSTVGVPAADLFFGFEELEFGLRLRAAGYCLLVDGDRWRAERIEAGTFAQDPRSLRTPKATTAWRRYYSTRNLTLIARQYGTVRAVAYVSILGGANATLALLLARRPLRDVLLPFKGALDGLLGRTGRRVDPGFALKIT